MRSRLLQSHGGAESHYHEDSTSEEEEEDWSDSPSEKQPRKPQAPKRQHTTHTYQPERQQLPSNEYYSNFTSDPYMRQARNETVPYNGDYTYDPLSPSPYYGAYQPHSNPSYYSALNNPSLAGYARSYSYPIGPNGYSSGSPPTTMPYPNAQALPPYAQPGGYNPPQNVQHTMGYTNTNNAAPYPYDSADPSSSYPQYPTRAPRKPPAQPTTSRQPNPGRRRTVRGDRAEQQPSRKRHSISRNEKSSSHDQDSMVSASSVMKRLDDLLDYLQMQRDDKSHAARSDPGRYRDTRRFRSSSAMSEYDPDETRSLDIERLESDHIMGTIYRLLKERKDQGYRQLYGRSSGRSIAALLEESLGLHVRDRDGDKSSTENSNDRGIETKLDAILQLLLRNELKNSQTPQQPAPDAYDLRQDRQPAKARSPVTSPESFQEPATTPSNQEFLRRQGSQSMPRGGWGRRRRDSQYDTAQPSNQAPPRHNPPREAEPDEQIELDDYYFEECEPQYIPPQRHPPVRRSGTAQDIRRPQRTRSQASVHHERSDIRNIRMSPLQGDQQRVRPGRYQYVDDDYESEDQEPVPPREPMPYTNRHWTREAQPPPQSAPDPPPPQRRTQVRFI
ncbi:hypothetical protein FSARC_14008 [Fusarium sarcochroum]|uniref:Uncharacterized protein n=1 Tax=Fusarium sarcochroum TaxID=1208366 RepID=A0A8H4WQP7_9HYPO|nr:hypothetical protein FSARC_14008 [Fusarium sarcochroum]